LIINLKK
jgi:hypothetical protein